MNCENKLKGKAKGQMSFTLKPFTMLMIIIMLIFLYVYLNSNEVKKEEAKKDLEIRSASTDILLLLANSEDCLAYQLPSGVSAYANIIDVNKLEEFSEVYNGIEPSCARNYDFGFRVEVVEIVMTSMGPREAKKWSFGVQNFSREYHNNLVSYWMPVALKYSEKEVGIGKIRLTIFDGDLQKVAGFLDRSCTMGRAGLINQTSQAFQISYPISYEGGQLCIGMKNKACRKTLCDINMENITAKGNYRLEVSFERPNRLILVT